jgi:hypothetical protein
MIDGEACGNWMRRGGIAARSTEACDQCDRAGLIVDEEARHAVIDESRHRLRLRAMTGVKPQASASITEESLNARSKFTQMEEARAEPPGAAA